MNAAYVFFDALMHICRFTRQATRAYRLAQSVVERHFSDIKTNPVGDDVLIHLINALNRSPF